MGQENVIRIILSEYPDLWKEPKRFKAVLLDYCPENKLERNLIIHSVEECIPNDLLHMDDVDELVIKNLAKRITSAVGCENEKAIEIVSMWVEALDSNHNKSNSVFLHQSNLIAFKDLDDAELRIINWPMDTNFLIKGNRGCGKTTMAIYKALQLSNMGNKVIFIAYNRPSAEKVSLLINESSVASNITVLSINSFIDNCFKNVIGELVPRRGPFDYKWDEINEIGKKNRGIVPFIVSDDADLYPEAMSFISNVGNVITCFTNPFDGVGDYIRKLYVECPYTLVKNYRNSKEINNLAKIFWDGNGIFSEAYRCGRKPKMVKVSDWEKQYEYLLCIVKENLDKRIGIIVNAKALNKLYSDLSSDLDGMVSVVSPMKTQEDNAVTLVSFGTTIGMEFDMVVILALDKMKLNSDEGNYCEFIYRAISCARDELVITFFNEKSRNMTFSPIERIMNNKELCSWI